MENQARTGSRGFSTARHSAQHVVAVLLEDVYKYSSTQINLPPDLANYLITWGKLNVPDEDLYVDPKDGGKGRETESHITVKYGLKVSAVPPVLKKIIESTPAFKIELGKISMFENDKFDVVKLDVISPELHALNKRVSDALPHDDTHPTYNPHVTIAYVQKGKGQHLVGEDAFGTERGMSNSFVASEVQFSGAGDSDDGDRIVEKIPLMRESPEDAPEDMAYKVVWADGRGVQYFQHHSDALDFSQEEERDADPPKLVRRPKGARTQEAVDETGPFENLPFPSGPHELVQFKLRKPKKRLIL